MTSAELDRKISEKWRCACSAADIQRLLLEHDKFRVDRARVMAGIRRHVDARTENKRLGRPQDIVTKLLLAYRRAPAGLSAAGFLAGRTMKRVI